MQARGQAKVREAVRRRMGKEPASEKSDQKVLTEGKANGAWNCDD
jgi:hypothetical protein